jgi:antitoxin component of MazEF toxin-antitoxin module
MFGRGWWMWLELFTLLVKTKVKLEIEQFSMYNVITMKSTIIQIGNSRGIRIPKVMLEESGIDKNVDIKVTRDGLKITAVKTVSRPVSETLVLSQKTLAKDWDRPEEDAAWANL